MYPPYPSLLVWVRKILISIHNNSFATYIRQGKIPDGITHQCARNGTVLTSEEAFAGKCTGGAYFTLRDPAVWNADRQQCICHEGSEYVCA